MKATKQTDRARKSKSPSEKSPSESRTPCANLDNRYGRIGISAVAAAVRCKGETEKPPAAAKAGRAAHYESD